MTYPSQLIASAVFALSFVVLGCEALTAPPAPSAEAEPPFALPRVGATANRQQAVVPAAIPPSNATAPSTPARSDRSTKAADRDQTAACGSGTCGEVAGGCGCRSRGTKCKSAGCGG